MKASDFRTDGVMALSNYGGVEIMLNSKCDAAIYRWYGRIARRWQEIKYNRSGRGYITIANRRYHLDEFLRTH